MSEVAYALAVYADVRDELRPEWTRHLRQDVRVLLNVELQELRSGEGSQELTGWQRLHERISSISCPDFEGSSSVREEFSEKGSEAASDGDGLQGEAVGDGQFEARGAVLDLLQREDADGLFTRGVLSFQDRKYEAALVAFSRSLQLQTTDTEVWAYRGDCYHMMRLRSEAHHDYTRALELDDKNHRARRGRAETNVWMRHYREAIADARAALRQDKRDALMHYFKGMAHFGQQQNWRALFSLSRAIRYWPDFAQFYLARSRVLEALQRHRGMQTDMARALWLDPALADPANREITLAGRREI